MLWRKRQAFGFKKAKRKAKRGQIYFSYFKNKSVLFLVPFFVQAIFYMRLFDALIPVISSAIAIWAVASYSITEEKPHEIRLEQEAMRGEA
jgi:hypothetical protein